MPAYTVAGSPIGVSPIGHAALTIGVGLGVQRFAAQWFRDGMVPAGLLTNDDEVPSELATLVQERWKDSLNGNREPVVLGDGWKYEQVSIAPEESQFLDTFQANVSDVARFFGVEPENIGGTRPGGSSMTYQNVEQAQIHLLVRTIQPWLVRLERALTSLRPRPRFVKFNPDALLRVDAETRAKVHDVAIRGGWQSPDETRALEDREPIPNGKGNRFLYPPGRMQLDDHELKLGADSDPEGDLVPQPVLPPEPPPEPDVPDPGQQPAAVGTNGQTGDD
jgi:HK97 family phage portal protein